MKLTRIAEILKMEGDGREITVKGWVRTKRGNKNVAFIALNDGSCVANIQVVVDLAKIDEAERKAAAAVQYHTVRSGDTLGALARKYGTTVTRICQLNGIKSTSIIRIGQRLRVR